jgi:hypothetical protein
MPTGSARRLVSPYADALLARDLPALDPARRADTVEFVATRVSTLPSPMLLGVTVLAWVFDLLLRLGSRRTFIAVSTRIPLPFVSEYPRLIRSLAFAYVWERWPDTRPDGGRAPARP